MRGLHQNEIRHPIDLGWFHRNNTVIISGNIIIVVEPCGNSGDDADRIIWWRQRSGKTFIIRTQRCCCRTDQFQPPRFTESIDKWRSSAGTADKDYPSEIRHIDAVQISSYKQATERVTDKMNCFYGIETESGDLLRSIGNNFFGGPAEGFVIHSCCTVPSGFQPIFERRHDAFAAAETVE